MGRLKEEGIECWLKDENTVTIDPIIANAVGGIKLMVEEEKAEASLGIIKPVTSRNIKPVLFVPNADHPISNW